jgi:hypothetical protein
MSCCSPRFDDAAASSGAEVFTGARFSATVPPAATCASAGMGLGHGRLVFGFCTGRPHGSSPRRCGCESESQKCTKVASDRLSEPPSSRTSLALLSHLRRMSSGTSQPGQTSLMTRPAGASTDLRCGPTLVFHPTPCKSSLLPHGSSMSSCRVWLEIVLHRWRYRESKTTVRIRTGLLPESALSSVRSGRVACALRVCSEGQGVAGLSGEKARRVLWLTRFWYCQERMSHLNAFAHRRIHCRIAFVRRRKAWMPSP